MVEGSFSERIRQGEGCWQRRRDSDPEAPRIAGHHAAGIEPPPVSYFLAYLGIGFVIYLAMRLWFRRTGVDPAALDALWGGLLGSEAIILMLIPLAWPLVIGLSLLLWAAEYFHLISKHRAAEERQENLGRTGKYSSGATRRRRKTVGSGVKAPW